MDFVFWHSYCSIKEQQQQLKLIKINNKNNVGWIAYLVGMGKQTSRLDGVWDTKEA